MNRLARIWSPKARRRWQRVADVEWERAVPWVMGLLILGTVALLGLGAWSL